MEKEIVKNSKNLLSDTNTEVGSQTQINKKDGKDEQNKKYDNIDKKESNKEILIYENLENRIQREADISNKEKIQNILNNQNDININNININENEKIKSKNLEKQLKEKNDIEKVSERKKLKNVKNKSKNKRKHRHRCDYIDCCPACCDCFYDCNCCNCESCSCNYFCRYCCENSSRNCEIF